MTEGTSEFDKRKKLVLTEIESNINHDSRDKSRQGFIDKEIESLVFAINRTSDFYTTSSCAGRILLLFRPDTKNKSEVVWIYKSHEVSDFGKIKDSLNKFIAENRTEGVITLKQEPMIVHVETRDIDCAQRLIIRACDAGFKRKSIIGIKRRTVVEITSSHFIDFPIGENSRLFCSEEYLEWVLGFANRNLMKNRDMIANLEKEISGKEK